MRCYRVLDLAAEGLSAYRRCRDALQRDLGLPPSAATEALRAALRDR
jgi:hypothetical protein